MPDCMKCLAESGLGDAVREAAAAARPFLGLCIGLQMLFERSDEGDTPGLEVGNGAGVRELLYVDAHQGFVVDQITGIEQLHRTIYHRNLGTTLWSEGDLLPYSGTGEVEDGEVNQLIDFAEDTYQIFENLSGGDYLSYDGRNAVLRSIYEDQNLSCPNARWTGSYTGFCRSTTSDDVVAHEWTHAYTDATHDLIYQWQPGALNEAFSDIFGELVDQINGAGTDEARCSNR